jgi:hypothetical protein
MICQYGCERKARYKPTKGMTKWCCESHYNKCPAQIKLKTQRALKSGKLFGRTPWNKGKRGVQNAWNKGKTASQKSKEKMSISSKLTITKIKNRYPLFFKIEKMRYNPDKPGEREIQVHCKNHLCKNSKEEGGWFTPTYIQFYERIRQLEKEYGNGGSYLYCSEKCKIECPLYYIFDDPFKNKQKLYMPGEYKLWKTLVLQYDGYKCQKCFKDYQLDVHHINPEKSHPHLVLDVSNGITLCRTCHLEIGHRDEYCKLSTLRRRCQPKMGSI